MAKEGVPPPKAELATAGEATQTVESYVAVTEQDYQSKAKLTSSMESEDLSSPYVARKQNAEASSEAKHFQDTSRDSRRKEKRTGSMLWRGLKKLLKEKKIQNLETGNQGTDRASRESRLANIINVFQTRITKPIRTGNFKRVSLATLESENAVKKWSQSSTGQRIDNWKTICKDYFGRIVDTTICCLLLVQGLLLPILFSFRPTDRWMYNLQYVTEIVCILDAMKSGYIVFKTRSIAWLLLSSREKNARAWLALDVVASIPMNIFLGYHVCWSIRGLCSIPIAIKGMKISNILGRATRHFYTVLESTGSRSCFRNGMRIVRLIYFILFFINIWTCLWFLVGSNEDRPSEDWFRDLNENVLGINHDAVVRTNLWIQSCYATLLILNGEGIGPLNTQQFFFCSVLMIVGLLCTSLLIGETANVLNKMTAARAAYELKREQLDYMMSYNELPKLLQDRIRDYYRFLWDEHRCLDGDPTPFVRELSPSIRVEVDLFLKRGLILQSSLFSEASPEFLRDVSSELSIVFYLQGDYILREGEKGHSMYFVSRGTLRVTIKGNYIKDMEAGDCFG